MDEGRDEVEQELVFRYSRRERLAKASERVRRLAGDDPARRQTLLGTLTATKSLAFLFLAIIMLSVTALVMTFLLPPENRTEIAGNRFTVSALRYQQSTYVVIKKVAVRPDAGTGILLVAAIGADSGAGAESGATAGAGEDNGADSGAGAEAGTGEPGRYAGSFAVDARGEQEFRFALDGEITDLSLLVDFGAIRKTLRLRAE